MDLKFTDVVNSLPLTPVSFAPIYISLLLTYFCNIEHILLFVVI